MESKRFPLMAAELRRRAIFKVVPFLNPDGVINGHHRTGLGGLDLNRHWTTPELSRAPTIWHLRSLILTLQARAGALGLLAAEGASLDSSVPDDAVAAPAPAPVVVEAAPAAAAGLARRHGLRGCRQHAGDRRGHRGACRADGGVGGPSEGQPEPHPIPDRKPDLTIDFSDGQSETPTPIAAGDLVLEG